MHLPDRRQPGHEPGHLLLPVKPLNWEGHSKKFRHILVVTDGPLYRMMVYLYCVGDEAIWAEPRITSENP